MHRMKSKSLAIIMASVMVLATVGTAFAATDTQGHWAQQKLDEWAKSGLITGYPDGSMKPNAPVTRAEFVAFLNRTLKGKDANATCSFTDVKKTDWFYADVATAAAAGYIKGYDNGSFKPLAAISRQEAAVIVGRVIGIGIPDVSLLRTFNDQTQIAEWAKPSVAALVAKGLITGYQDGTFGANKQITRAETVMVLDRGIVSVVAPAPTPAIVYSGGGGYSGPATVSVYANPTMSLAVGGTAQIAVTATPADAVLGFISSSPSIASVSPTGLVTGIGQGTATITVAGSRNGYAAGGCSVTVTVSPASLGTVTVTAAPTTMNLLVGQGMQITASASQAAATFSYVSNNSAVATVSSTGLVTGVAAGTATIAVTGGKTGYTSGTATVAVTVTTPPPTGVAVALAPTQSGIGNTATVTITGYPTATQYRLLKADGSPLCSNVNVGSTVVVMFVNAGDQVKVELYDAANNVIETKTVTTTGSGSSGQTGSVSVALADTASGIGMEATVTLSGYTGATQYRLLKLDGTALTGYTPAANKVVVMFLNPGDSCKVEVLNNVGLVLETKTVVTTGTSTAHTGTATVVLEDAAGGIGKVATVAVTGFTGGTQYRLLKTDGTALTSYVNLGSTVVVLFLNPGDTCQVEVANTSQVALGRVTVTATAAAPVERTVTVVLTPTATGIGKVATVTIAPSTGLAQYRLLKADNTPLTGKVNVGSTVVVMFVNPGDTCKVELYAAGDVLRDTKTVTAQ